MSLKGTHKILEDAAGLPPVDSKEQRKSGRRNIRGIMLWVSFCVGIVSVIILSFAFGFDWIYLCVAIVACIPALFHKFVIPERPDMRHYFQVAAMYATVWGAVPFVCLYTAKLLPDVGGYMFLGALLLLWCLGAFLPRWM